MNILIGLAIWLVFFICIGLSFFFGYKQGLKIKKPISADEKEKLQRELALKGMQNILSYDYQKALGGEK